MQKIGVIIQHDVCGRAKRKPILRIEMCLLIRTCEMPMEYVVHYPKIYRGVVDIVSYRVLFRVQQPSQMQLSMSQGMHILKRIK